MDAWISAGAGLFGALIGFIGSWLVGNRSIEANRKKDNFQITKDALEARIASLSRIENTSSSLYLEFGQDQPSGAKIRTIGKEHVRVLCEVIAENHWGLSDEVMKLVNELRKSACILTFLTNPSPEEEEKKVYEEFGNIQKNEQELHTLVDSKLNQLLEEHKLLIQQGIPK